MGDDEVQTEQGNLGLTPMVPTALPAGVGGVPQFYMPTKCADDWRALLAKPEKHWRSGYSAKALAESWQSGRTFPEEVAQALRNAFADIEFLCGFPEYEVRLPSRGNGSRNDILVLARTSTSLMVIAVEGKVNESFGPLVSDWLVDASPGKRSRFEYLADVLGLSQAALEGVRYQLLHRAVSSVVEAQRFHADHALLLVHSFSAADTGFVDFQHFLGLYGAEAQPDSVVYVRDLAGTTLHAAWVRGTAAGKGM